MRLFYLVLLFFISTLPHLQAQEIREYIDLQMHPAMHIPYRFFGKGFSYFPDGKPPKLRYKHLLKNVAYANYFKNNKAARIIVTGALTKENVRSRRKARKVILRQIDYVNRFAEENAEDFAVARNPQEARDLIHNTQKTVIIHSIEGGRKLIETDEDAQFWAKQGVAFVTLIHLVDSELGSAAIYPKFITRLINLKGFLRRKKKRGGLTEKGKQTILRLANAGIMTDITHMSDQCRTDALNFMQLHQIPPISTHDGFKPIQNHPRGISADEILQIYQNGGFISLPISGISLMPYRPQPLYKQKIDSLGKNYCNGSIDTYKLTYEAVKNLIESNYSVIANDDKNKFSELSDSQKVPFSIGFQSDFNGWLNHSRPKYGKKGCTPIDKNKNYEAIELHGMPHPGYMASQWQVFENEGVDLAPIKRNSEHFLQIWAYFTAHTNSFGPK